MTRPDALTVRSLSVRFDTEDSAVYAVNGVDLSVASGKTLCLVGESGCGKSATLRAIAGILPRHATVTGEIAIAGQSCTITDSGKTRIVRSDTVALVFQDATVALDPVYSVGHQITETIRRHSRVSASAARARAVELLELVGVPAAKSRLESYPHELSGGMRQRVMIAIALSCDPTLLLADEATTALDVTVQMQVLILLRQLQERFGMGMLFVTHDLGVAVHVADEIAVMYAGSIVEAGPTGRLIGTPAHPYTKALLAANLEHHPRGTPIETVSGAPPDLTQLPDRCSFLPRCSARMSVCRNTVPETRYVEAGHRAACLALVQREQSETK